jgi:hypothetical protein
MYTKTAGGGSNLFFKNVTIEKSRPLQDLSAIPGCHVSTNILSPIGHFKSTRQFIAGIWTSENYRVLEGTTEIFCL